MAHLRKRNAKWYVRYTDENGKSKEKALSKDKGIARQMMANIVRDVERRKAGLADDFTQHARQPIAMYLGEYREELESRDRTREHIENTLACCERIVSDCGFSRISDLDESRVKRWLKTRRESGLSVRSSNRYSTAIKSFARWLWVTRKTATHLLVGLKALNPDVDKRHERRALSDADFGKLLATTAASQRVDKVHQGSMSAAAGCC